MPNCAAKHWKVQAYEAVWDAGGESKENDWQCGQRGRWDLVDEAARELQPLFN